MDARSGELTTLERVDTLVDASYTGTIETNLAPPQCEADTMRLRHALHHLHLHLREADSEVKELIKNYEKTIHLAEKDERRAMKLREEANECDADADWHRRKAWYLLQLISSKLASTAMNMHVQTAPFVQIEHQQALQLQCWLLEGRRWRQVRIKVGDGLLVHTRVARAAFSRRRILKQMSIELSWIEATRADGDVIIKTGPCSVEPRWQWTCLLSPAGKQACKKEELVFCCETVCGWTRRRRHCLCRYRKYPHICSLQCFPSSDLAHFLMDLVRRRRPCTSGPVRFTARKVGALTLLQQLRAPQTHTIHHPRCLGMSTNHLFPLNTHICQPQQAMHLRHQAMLAAKAAIASQPTTVTAVTRP